MASSVVAKRLANLASIAAVTGVGSVAFYYAGKKALAIEMKDAENESAKIRVPGQQKKGLSFAPQYDGLHCFETVVSKAYA